MIEVKATDRAGLSLTKNLTININDLNEAPVLTDDSVTANSSSAKVIANSYLLSNDRDPESQPLSLIGVSNVNGGTVSRQQNTVSFTPATNFNGTAYFQYTNMFNTIISSKCFSYLRNTTVDARVFQSSQDFGVSLSSHNGTDHCHASNSSDVTYLVLNPKLRGIRI